MIHHVSLGTSDVKRARTFYDAVMPVLGLRLLKSNNGAAHYGVGEIIFSVVTPVNGKPASAGNGVHIAFPARTRAMVDEFYNRGLKHGGKSDGAPGLRPEYDVNYYGAFLYDPDGNKVEALIHRSRSPAHSVSRVWYARRKLTQAEFCFGLSRQNDLAAALISGSDSRGGTGVLDMRSDVDRGLQPAP